MPPAAPGRRASCAKGGVRRARSQEDSLMIDSLLLSPTTVYFFSHFLLRPVSSCFLIDVSVFLHVLLATTCTACSISLASKEFALSIVLVRTSLCHRAALTPVVASYWRDVSVDVQERLPSSCEQASFDLAILLVFLLEESQSGGETSSTTQYRD